MKRQIKWQILIPTLLIFIVSFVGILAIVLSMASMAISDLSKELMIERDVRFAGEVQETVNYAMSVTRLLHSAGMNAAGDKTREYLTDALATVLEGSPSVFGVYALWEPDAYDGVDAEYINKPGGDETGRFNVYYFRGKEGIRSDRFHFYNTEGIGDYYLTPKKTGRESVVVPHWYELEDNMYYILSVSAPVIKDGKFLGVVGTAILVDAIAGKLEGASLFETGYLFMLDSDGRLIYHPDARYADKKIFDYLNGEEKELISGSLDTGEAVFADIMLEWSNEKVRLSVLPVLLGDKYWAIGSVVPVSEVNSVAERTLIFGIGLALITLIVILTVLPLFITRITNMIKAITVDLQRLAVRDIDIPVKENVDGEIGDMHKAFNMLLANTVELIEAQKELIIKDRNLQTIIDSMRIPLRITDSLTGEIIYANKECLKLFEAEFLEDFCGKYVSDFAPDSQSDGTNTYDKIAYLLSSKDTVNTDVEYYTVAGNIIDAHVTGCTVDYYGKKATLGIITDLKEQKEQKRLLLSAAEKEKEANQLKSRFLVNMSHEIRTPMNAIIGLTEIELRKNIERHTKEIYKKINVSAKNLLDIINDILDLSKIEADKIELFCDEFELTEVMSSAMLVASPRLDGKNVELILNAALDLPRFVIGDRTRLWQILKNFLDNSAKYTEEGKIVLTVFTNTRSSDKENIYLTFIIEDTGIGISEKRLQEIFVPYTQVYNEAQKRYTGTGLGMAISKQLCEIMGGTMQIESRERGGTSIHLTIPFKRSANTETAMQSVKTPELTGIKILAVDDDEISLSIMREIITGSNALCETARSGEEAMEIILRHRNKGEVFDLILLDYMMDGINGLETARRIQTGVSVAPKLLMVTAYQRMLIKQELDNSNISDVIEKPFIPPQLINRICTALGYVPDNSDKPESVTRFEDAQVLLCEDYPLNQEVAVGMLEQFGIIPTVVENGKEGIELLSSGKKFDLILMDLQMPVMDGYEATRIIRGDKRFDDIPIISLTADAMKEITDKCMEMGMNGHIAKPVEFSRLHEMLLKWLPAEKRAETNAENPESETLNTLTTRSGGKTDRLKNALIGFTEDLHRQWPDFDGITGSPESLAEMKRYVHKIKGAAGNLGENELYKSAADFEESLRNTPEKYLYECFIQACNNCGNKIKNEVITTDETPADTGNAKEAREVLDALNHALLSYDMKKISQEISKLKEKKWQDISVNEIKKLCELAKDFDYDAMLDIVKTMRGITDE